MTDTKNNGSVLIVEAAEKQVRVARNFQSITKGALSLELNDRIDLCKALKLSIQNEVAANQAVAQNSAKAADGL